MRNKKPDLTNKKALAISSLSGHGAALFLSVAVPFQMIGRVDGNILAGAFILGAVGVVAFGFGAFLSASCVELSEQETDRSKEEYARKFGQALRIFLGAGMLVGLIFFFTGASLLMQWEKTHPSVEVGGEPPT